MPSPNKVISSRSVVLPQSKAGRNGRIVKSHHSKRSLLNGTGVFLLAIVPLTPGIAQQAAGQGLDWRYEPGLEGCDDPVPAEERPEKPAETGEIADRTLLPAEALAQNMEPGETQDPAPVVLPQQSWPEVVERRKDWGWQWKEPSFGTSDRLTSYDEDRAAVEIAEQRQTKALAKSAPPPPGIEVLPDQLQGLNYHVDFGIEFRF